MKLRDRFEDKIFYSPCGCWFWVGAMDKDGYGLIRSSSKLLKAHRVSWELNIGLIPDGMQVLHQCDNPLCVSPHHLFLGTHDDNMTDRQMKGRQVKGSSHPRAKLDSVSISIIKEAYQAGFSQVRIAKYFGVHGSMASRIVGGKSWSHLNA